MLENYRAGIDAVFGEGACHTLNFRKEGGTKVI